MADVLHPVGDGLSSGDIQIVGEGAERFTVLSPMLDDDRYIAIEGRQGNCFDTRIQTRGPIAFGDAVVRGRFARKATAGAVEFALALWGENPRCASTIRKLIAETRNTTIWHDDWIEYAIPLIGKQTDLVAECMGDLWLRTTVVAAVSGVGSQLPLLGVSALWLEVPTASTATFVDATAQAVPANTLVQVVTTSGRTFAARKNAGGEWRDENGNPVELDSSMLPTVGGELPPSRAVKGWGQ